MTLSSAEVVERIVVLRDLRIIADTTPREVFSNRELMQSTHITPPQISELTLRLKERHKMKDMLLSIEETLQFLGRQLDSSRPRH